MPPEMFESSTGPDPKILEPTDAIIRLSATCICGSDLWPYPGNEVLGGATPMGHEYCGIVEEVGSAVNACRPGGHVGFVGVTHEASVGGMDLFMSLVHLHGGPAPVRRFLPELMKLIANATSSLGRSSTSRSLSRTLQRVIEQSTSVEPSRRC